MTKIINTNTADAFPKRKIEDLDLLAKLDKIFLDKRGYVVKMPKAGSIVVPCLSGGLDSVSNLVVLMERFKFEVYPFFIKRKQTNYEHEWKAVQFFNKYYKERYPKLYHEAIAIEANTPGYEYKEMARATKLAGDYPIAYPARNPIIFLTGMDYAHALKSKLKNPPMTVFASISDNYNDELYHSALTSIRLLNLLMCQITNDYNWQFISIQIEREFGNCYDKDVYIKYATEQGVPLGKSRSCIKTNTEHCGVCNSCTERRKAFKKANIEDPTIYEN